MPQPSASNTPKSQGNATLCDDGGDKESKANRRRARDAERKRLKRAADAELRQREAAIKRQKRAADVDLRQRETAAKRLRRAAATPSTAEDKRKKQAAAKRQRRAADPEVRQREAAAKRRRRNATVREREAASKRRQRESAPDAARQRERAAKAASRAKQYASADARFKRDFLDHSFGQPLQRRITPGFPRGEVPCLRHGYGQLADQLTCVPAGMSHTMLPCTCGKELNGTSTSQQMDSETTTTVKIEPEESAASDEEFFEMPLAIEMGIGEEPCNPPASVKDEPLDIPAAPTENAGEANEILGITGIEILVHAAECQGKEGAEDESRTSTEEARSTCLP